MFFSLLLNMLIFLIIIIMTYIYLLTMPLYTSFMLDFMFITSTLYVHIPSTPTYYTSSMNSE